VGEALYHSRVVREEQLVPGEELEVLFHFLEEGEALLWHSNRLEGVGEQRLQCHSTQRVVEVAR
jgi:hypothetical protein